MDNRHLTILYREDGTRFRGQISAPRTAIEGSPLFPFRRVLLVSPSVAMTPGIVINTPDGSRYLVVEGEDAYQVDKAYETFRLIEMDREVFWKQPTISVDPLTGLKMSSGWGAGQTKWVLIEENRTSSYDQGLMVKYGVGRFYCGFQPAVGDRFDNFLVEQVVSGLGIWYGTVK